MRLFIPSVKRIFSTSPSLFGMGLALLGSLIITPDTLLIRISGLEGWSLTFWRGILIGFSLVAIWALLAKDHLLNDLNWLNKPSFLIILVATAINNVAFNFAAIETSITVVLTALATAPILAAGLSFVVSKETTGKRTWITILATLLGVTIVIFNGDQALGAPSGSVLFGGLLGLISALGIAMVFVMARQSPHAPVLLAIALGNILSGIVAFILVGTDSLSIGPERHILVMGLGIMPLAMALLSLAPRYTAPTNVSLFMLLELVLGPFWVWIGVGEKPSPLMILGSLIVLVTLTFYLLSVIRENRQ
ncbi:MAG: DMT family transporter [Pseudomonadota bacterium]|nr:DMT family transporter [Pseudomonadota bacterium]